MIEVRKLTKVYRTGKIEFTALKDIDLKVETGEFLGIMGRSGSGKSTLMYQMSLLDRPTSGDVLFNGQVVSGNTEDVCSRFRLDNLGYVFQSYALLLELTAEENVALPAMMAGRDFKTAQLQARKALDSVGLSEKYTNLPNRLSGGEQQRVSIARAIVNDTAIVFADEPTASLDSQTAELVMDTFREMNKRGRTVVIVTHEPDFAGYFDRVVTLGDGRIESIE